MTQINATILNQKEFEEKEKELKSLLASIDLYSTVEQTKDIQEEAQELFDDLAKNLYALDCAYLDAKVQTFTQVLDTLKN